MFRPFRPAFEKLEKREVFSAGPLGLAAAAQPQGVIHPFSDFAIQPSVAPLSGAASHNGGAIHFGPRAASIANLASAAPSASAESDADSDGADFLVWQRQAQPADQTAAADFDNDGVVDGADLLVWLRQAQPADQTPPSAIWLEGTYRSNQQQAAPERQPTAITGSYDAATGILTAVPNSQPTAAADFDNDGDVDGADFLAVRSATQSAPDSHTQRLLGNGDGTFQSQIMPEEEDANDVNSLTAQAHDRFFAALGMASQRSMQQNYHLTLAQPWQ